MNEIPGMEKPDLQELPQISDRLSFLYLEHCQLSREDSAILVRDEKRTVRIPVAAISTLLLGEYQTWTGNYGVFSFRGTEDGILCS